MRTCGSIITLNTALKSKRHPSIGCGRSGALGFASAPQPLSPPVLRAHVRREKVCVGGGGAPACARIARAWSR
jgi:hypothetical protein